MSFHLVQFREVQHSGERHISTAFRRSWGVHMNKLAVGMFAAILLLIGGTVYILVREGDRVPLSASVINPEQLFGRANATVTTKARTMPVQSVDLSFPHNNLLPEAAIAEVLVRQGDKVEKGAPLARLDTRVLEMRVAESQAALAQAKA